MTASAERIVSARERWEAGDRPPSRVFADLVGQTVVVTGCTGGIGAAICRSLREAGAFVLGSDVAQPEGSPGEADGFAFAAADLTDPSSTESLIDLAVEAGATSLVNNAGCMDEQLLADTDEALWHRTLELNLTAAYRLTRGLAESISGSAGGSLVNVASQVAFRGGARLSAYAASKAGIIGLTRSLAHEFGPRTRVNAVAPGPVESPMTREFMSDEWLEAKTRNLIMRRLGRPEEVAAAVRFLLSGEAGFMTGQTLSVNGGGYLA